MKALFMNGSPRKDGNTAKLAKELLENTDCTTLNLTDLLIGSYGQTLE